MEVAVYVPDHNAQAPCYGSWQRCWPTLSLQVLRWIILPQKGVTGEKALELARQHLAELDERRFAAGTDAEFVAVNRTAPPLRMLEILSFSLNPQVHAFDNASLMENLERSRTWSPAHRR